MGEGCQATGAFLSGSIRGCALSVKTFGQKMLGKRTRRSHSSFEEYSTEDASYSSLKNLRLYECLIGANVRLEETQYGLRNGRIIGPTRYFLLYENQLRRIISCIEGSVSLRILDVGCGDGVIASLVPSHHRVVGIDLALSRVRGCQIALSASGQEFAVADAQHLPCPDEYFDLVIFSEIIEHLPNPGSALEEVRRVLKHGGRIVISTPGAVHHLGEIGELYEHQHLQLFSSRSLRDAVTITGFEVVNSWHIGADLRLGIWRSPITDRIVTSLFSYRDKRFKREHYLSFGILETRWLTRVLDRLYRQGGLLRKLFFIILHLCDCLSDRIPALSSQMIFEARKSSQRD